MEEKLLNLILGIIIGVIIMWLSLMNFHKCYVVSENKITPETYLTTNGKTIDTLYIYHIKVNK